MINDCCVLMWVWSQNIAQQDSKKEATLETTMQTFIIVCGNVRAPLLQMLSIVGHNTHVPSKRWGGILTQNRAISRQHVKAWGHKVAWDAPSLSAPPPSPLLCSLFVPPKMEPSRPLWSDLLLAGSPFRLKDT